MCQHKRPGRTARAERIRRHKEREMVKWIHDRTIVQLPCRRKQRDGYMGRIVAVGIPPELEELA